MKGGFVMPFSKENSMREHIGQDDISGFLAEGTEIKGEIRFKDILRIDGKVGGTIVSEGELVIGENGEGTYVALISELLPLGIKGVVAAALLAALMSTVSGALNSIATITSSRKTAPPTV